MYLTCLLYCVVGNGLRNCTKCVSPFVLYKHYCIRECPQHGWVLDSDHQKCVKCHSSCARCIGPTANDCIACSQPYASLVGFSCKKKCPRGTFHNQLTGLCERCHPTCETCSEAGADNCMSCAKDLIRNESTRRCSSVCPQGQFSSEGKCSKCHQDCKSCNGPYSSNCLNCPDGKAFYNFTCVDACPDRTYITDKDGIHQCRPCHPVCHSCNGPSMDSCRLCKSPLYLERRMCVVQCSPNHSVDERTRSCHPCGNECKTSARDKNRSVQYPNDNALKFVLEDPKKSGVSVIAIAAVSVSIVIFLVMFGVLQFRSKKKMRYHMVSGSKTEEEDECNVSLIEGEGDEHRA